MDRIKKHNVDTKFVFFTLILEMKKAASHHFTSSLICFSYGVLNALKKIATPARFHLFSLISFVILLAKYLSNF